LLFLNITTIEQVRNQAHRKLTRSSTPPNPFSIGNWFRNMAYLLFRPAGYAWVDLSGIAMHDTRKINPGFVVRPASAAEITVSEDQDDTHEDLGDDDWR
jgi:palmitoyltransferase ZDHHC9/14/18